MVHETGVNIKTYAFFDEGSLVTLIEENLTNKLNIDGPQEQLCILWTANTSRQKPNSKRVSIKISAIETKSQLYDIYNVRSENS